MAAEAPARPAVFTDADRQELARRLCELLYDLWCRTVEAGGRTPPGDDARPQTTAQEPPGGTNTERTVAILRQ